MRKKIIPWMIIVAMVFTMLPATAIPAFGAEMAPKEPTLVEQDINGDGTTEDVYQIKTANNLYWFAQYINSGNVSANAILIDDITINKDVLVDGALNSDVSTFIKWNAIGNEDKPYEGYFDGNGKTIKGIYLVNSDKNTTGYGFIGHATGNAEIKNLTISDSYFSAYQHVGAIVGATNSTTTVKIDKCKSKNNLVIAHYNAAGVCGSGINVNISSCINTSECISTDMRAGGICGASNSGCVIEDCINEGMISCNGGFAYVGGIVGSVHGETIIKRCNNSADNIGCGIVGLTNSTLTIEDCYNTGEVAFGGLVGNLNSNEAYINIKNSYTLERSVLQVSRENKYSFENCYFLGESEDNYDGTTVKSIEAFESGEVAYLLNGSTSEGDIVWHQNLDNDEEKSGYPVFSAGMVYPVEVTINCLKGQQQQTYSNTSGKIETVDHVFKYTATNNAITETCENGCDHNATATLEYAEGNGTYSHTGEAIEPLRVVYSDKWSGEELNVNYFDNMAIGTACGYIEVGDQRATKAFTIRATKYYIPLLNKTIVYGDSLFNIVDMANITKDGEAFYNEHIGQAFYLICTDAKGNEYETKDGAIIPVGMYDITGKGNAAVDENGSDTAIFTFNNAELTVQPKLLTKDDINTVTVEEKVFNGNKKAKVIVTFKKETPPTYWGGIQMNGVDTSTGKPIYDEITAVVEAQFEDAAVGNNKKVSYTITGLEGTAAKNYSLPEGGITGETTGNITVDPSLVPVDKDGDGTPDIYIEPEDVEDGVYTDPTTGDKYKDAGNDGVLDPMVSEGGSDKDNTTNTGDDFDLLLMMTIMLITLATMTVVAYVGRRRTQ